MASPISDLASVIFQDVAVYFSSEEWELLTDWQKELYKNVMREIHGALIALGYTIVNRSTLFRIKEKTVSWWDRDQPEPPTTGESISDPISNTSYPFVKPDIYLRIEQEETPCPWTRQGASGPVFDPELSLWIKQENGPCSEDQEEEEEDKDDESMHSPQKAENNPCIKQDVSWSFTREQRPCPQARCDSDGKKSAGDPSTSYPVFDSDLPRWIKQEKAQVQDGQQSLEKESLSDPGPDQLSAQPEGPQDAKEEEMLHPQAQCNSEGKTCPSEPPTTADSSWKGSPRLPAKPRRQAAAKRMELKLRDKMLVLQEYEKRKVSMRELATQFGVSKTQIGQIIKRKEELLTEYLNDASGDRVRRRRRTENEHLNSMVWDWIQMVRAENVALSGAVVKRKALELAEQLGVTEFKASNGWLDSFKKAHNLHQFTSVSCWSQGELR